MKRRKPINRNLIFMILLLVVTIGYAYLNSELKINGTAGIAGNTWDVHFENVVPSSSNTVTPTIAPVANPIDKVTDLTYSVKFNKPGDVYEFDVDIVNAGSIDAMVELITSTIKIGNGEVQEINNSTLPSYLNYYVKYSDGAAISSNHLLNKETRETIRVHVEYKADISEEDLANSAGKTIEFTYGLGYIQAGDGAKPRPLANNCTYNGELTQGAEYVNGQYTYRYMQHSEIDRIVNFSDDGWGVFLTNRNSTDPVTTPLCTSINGKPIVSMSSMFYNSKAPSIDLSSFDTSNVTNMQYMFSNMSAVTSLDVGYLDTSKVSNMNHMFYNNATLQTIINLDNFNTKNVLNMNYMFASSKKIKNIKITKWNTLKVTNVDYMFYYLGYEANNLTFEISNLNFPKVTSASYMFGSLGSHSSGTTNFKISNFNMNSLTNTSSVFYGALEDSYRVNASIDNISFNSTNNIDYLFRYLGEEAIEFNFTVTNLHARSANSAEGCVSYTGQGGKVTIKLKDWETPNLTSAYNMFNHIGQANRSGPIELTIDNIDFTNVTTMKMMFFSFGEGNYESTKIVFKNINTPNLTDTEYMFAYAGTCSSHLDIEGFENFDFSKVTNSHSMFWTTNEKSINFTHLGTIDLYADDISYMFFHMNGYRIIINLHKKPTNYEKVFDVAATSSYSEIIVNYSREVDNIDDIIATKSDNSNVIKGQLID